MEEREQRLQGRNSKACGRGQKWLCIADARWRWEEGEELGASWGAGYPSLSIGHRFLNSLP